MERNGSATAAAAFNLVFTHKGTCKLNLIALSLPP
jgi:hypothetical protein